MQWRWCAIHTFILNKLTASIVFVYVIAWERMKFGIHFTSCSENGNFFIIATTIGIYPKLSLLPVLSQINTISSFVKVIISDFQLASMMSMLFQHGEAQLLKLITGAD